MTTPREELKLLLHRLDGMTYGHSDDERADVLAAALRAEAGEALERAAHEAETWGNAPPNPHGRRAALAAAIRALIPPAAAPAAEVKVNACQVDLRTDKDRECFDDIVQAATRVLRSEPAAPAPDWSVRAGDKCTRVGCDKEVVAACLPHSFGGCDEHMREHDRRCAFTSLDRTAPPEGEGT